MHSCLYEGYVRHRRLSPAAHVFRYRLYLVYLDLDELPTLLEGKYGLGPGHANYPFDQVESRLNARCDEEYNFCQMYCIEAKNPTIIIITRKHR